jgi:Ca2+-binding RTX toxin-like protein
VARGVVAAPGAQTVNYGSIHVAAGHDALGFYGVTPAIDNYFVNLGTLDVAALGAPAHDVVNIAGGAAMFGGVFANAGEIHVSAHGVAIGVELLEMSTASNDIGGVIEAHASGPDAQAIGVLMGSPYGPSAAFVNQGLVRADVAITTFYGGFGGEIPGDDAVGNYGKIVGDISLGAGDDSVRNGGGGIQGSIRGDVLLGDGNDRFDSQDGKIDGAVWGGLDDDQLRGSKGADVLHGDDAAGLDGGADLLIGLKGADTLDGGIGQDTLNGGLGGDLLTGGGDNDADVFVYNRAADSALGGIDIITDLDNADTIDLHRIDADTGTGGDQAFHLVSSFTGQAGELVVYDAGGGYTGIAGDIDGDASSDFLVFVAGDHTDFTNFVL